MVWSLALCPDDAKQDSVVYGAEFGVVFLAKGPRTASIQEGLDCLVMTIHTYIHTGVFKKYLKLSLCLCCIFLKRRGKNALLFRRRPWSTFSFSLSTSPPWGLQGGRGRSFTVTCLAVLLRLVKNTLFHVYEDACHHCCLVVNLTLTNPLRITFGEKKQGTQTEESSVQRASSPGRDNRRYKK